MSDQVIYDVIIIGAGIQGAGIAQAAAANGWSVLVLEQYQKPAQGTSSKSSKLIHGGLRYLETFQFRLVYECLLERKRLLSNAPSLVRERRFVIPVYRSSTRSAFTVNIGLWLYSILSGDFRAKKFKRLNKKQWHSIANLKQENLSAVFEYCDAQTDDAKLTVAVISAATRLGSVVCYGEKVSALEYKNGLYLCGTETGKEFRAKTLVNASGPWVNQVSSCFNSAVGKIDLDLVQGTHLVVDIEPNDYCLYLESPIDGRAFFVLPWYQYTLVGTTEKKYSGDPANVQPTDEEIIYLINSFNSFFPTTKISRESIVNSFAGLRVLPKTSDKKLNQRSRDVQLAESKMYPGYITVCGGKLTSYRAVSERVVIKLENYLGKGKNAKATRSMSLE